MDLSIIIPAYNEEERIGPTLKSYIGWYRKHFKGSFEMIVMTDGCTDRSPQVARRMAGENVRHYDFKKRLGKGGAIAKGFKLSKGDIIAFTDADCSTTPKQLYKLVKHLKRKDCDGVIGSRYAEGADVTQKQGFLRRFSSRAFNLLVRVLFGLPYRDTQCGAKVFKRDAALDLSSKLRVTDWAFDVNLLYNALKGGYDVREVPLSWSDSPGSRFRLGRVAPRMGLSLLRLRLYESPLRSLVDNRLVSSLSRRLK